MNKIRMALLLLLASTAIASEAQNIASFKASLAAPAQLDSLNSVSATVRISEKGDAAAIIAGESSPESISGFRIVVFMSNTQSARQDAITARENCLLLYPAERSYLIYENPYFKVTLGNCSSQEEAIILLNRVRSTFPKAFIMRENIPVAEFRKVEEAATDKQPAETETATDSTPTL